MTWIKRHPLIWFFTASYVISWPAWVLESRGVIWASFPGYFGPAIAAMTIVVFTQGKEALEDLFTRTLLWRVSLKWYLAAIFIPLSIIFAVVPIQIIIHQNMDFDLEVLWSLFPQLLLLLIGGLLFGTLVAAGEEMGWRGYALPELLKYHNPLSASLVVGIFWGFWHFPLIWLLFDGQFNLINALLYAFGFMATSVFYTWLYLHAEGSILIASIFHSAYDTAALLVSSLPGNLFSFRVHMLLWNLMAMGLLILTRQLNKANTIHPSPTSLE